MRRSFSTLNFFLGALLFSISLQAEDDSILYEKIFSKKQKPRFETITLPFAYGGRVLGEIQTKLSSTEEILSIDNNSFLNITSEIIRPETLNELPKDDAPLTLQTLKDHNIKITYNKERVWLDLIIPPHLKKDEEHSIGTYKRPSWAYAPDEQAQYSGYLNWRAYRSFSYGAIVEDPMNIDLSPTLNLSRFVLEGDLYYKKRREEPWSRGDFRLTKEFPSKLIKLTAGDIIFPTKSFQNYFPSGGLSLTSDYSMNPYKMTTPLNAQNFFLKDDATADIYLNHKFVRKMPLKSGAHSLADLPLQNGLNDVRIDLTDSYGNKETLNFSQTRSDQLLRKGLNSFTYNIGLPSYEEGQNRLYRKMNEDYLFSFFHDYGFTNDLTAGLSAQQDRDQSVYSSEFIFTSFVGTTSLEGARSSDPSNITGNAFNLSHEFYDASRSWLLGSRITLKWEYLSPTFARLGEKNVDRDTLHHLYSTIGAGLGRGTSATFSYDQGFNQDQLERDPYGYSVTLHHRFKQNLSGNLTGGRSFLENGYRNETLFLFMHYSIPDKNQYVTSTVDIPRESQRVDWTHQADHTIGGINSVVSIENRIDQRDLMVREDYLHYLFETKLSGEINEQRQKESRGKANIQVGSAFAFAGNNFGISRPINGSFALVKNVKDGPDDLLVNPHEGYADAKSKRSLPAILPNLPAHHYSRLRFMSDSLNPLATIPREYVVVKPTYRAGYNIDLSNESSTHVRGTLKNKGHQILALTVGEIISLDRPTYRKDFFTDRKGRFMIESVPVGRCRLILPEGTYDFSLTTSKELIFDLKTVLLVEGTQ